MYCVIIKGLFKLWHSKISIICKDCYNYSYSEYISTQDNHNQKTQCLFLKFANTTYSHIYKKNRGGNYSVAPLDALALRSATLFRPQSQSCTTQVPIHLPPACDVTETALTNTSTRVPATPAPT